MNKKGYISIELVIVAGVVLVFGLYAVNRFVIKGKEANDTMEDALTKSMDAIKELNPNAGE